VNGIPRLLFVATFNKTVSGIKILHLFFFEKRQSYRSFEQTLRKISFDFAFFGSLFFIIVSVIETEDKRKGFSAFVPPF
jgi:restriction endonuclease